ncbi:MAG: GTP-binding protein, partial [Myxococcota bacterium]|nr:GTP-binding protein [Myxococcota bacterium]
MSKKGPGLERVRNIGIAAHIDAGKTTLTERVLYYTGANHRIGEVHDAQAHMDYLPEERAHGITITTAVTQCPWMDHLIQVVDTPGHVDFTIEVERAMRVLDGAVIVLDGVRGVEPQTETVWRQADGFNIPRMFFVNKMDRPGASYQRSLETLTERLGANPVPVCVPVDEGVLHLVDQQLVTFHGDRNTEVRTQPIPEHYADLVAEYRETLLLTAAEADPELEEAVLEEREVEPDRIWSALRLATLAGMVHPVFGGSALRDLGVQPLLDGMVHLLPSPLDRPPPTALDEHGQEQVVDLDSDGTLAALAFKVQLWDGRRHVFARLYRGRLSAGDKVQIARNGVVERAARVFDVDANSKRRLDQARAGQIVLLAGLREATTGDTLCSPGHPVHLESIQAREPVLGLAVEPETGKDEEKLVEVLDKVCQEDPTLRYYEDEETGQRILSGMGELHLQIVFERI